MGRAVFKCKSLEPFVCQPEREEVVGGKGGQGRRHSALHSTQNCSGSASQCTRWFLLLAPNPNLGSHLKVEKIFGVEKIEDLAVDFLFLPSDSKAETLP